MIYGIIIGSVMLFMIGVVLLDNEVKRKSDWCIPVVIVNESEKEES